MYGSPKAPYGVFMDDGNKPPPHGYGVNTDDPLADGLVGAWYMQEGGGDVVHDSAGGNHGTINGATWATGPWGPALQGDDINPAAVTDTDTEALNFTGDHTLMAWLIPNGTLRHGLISRFGERYKGWRFTTDYFDATHDKLKYYNTGCGTVSTGGVLLRSLTRPVQCALAVRVNVGGTFFVDGIEVGSWADTSSSPIPTTIPTPIRLGVYGETAWPLAGQLLQCSVFDRALSPSEIQALYLNPYASITPKTQFPFAAPAAGSTLPSLLESGMFAGGFQTIGGGL